MAILDKTLGIGELAQLVGVSTHALRVWERRYGAPKPLRRPSGHRRYSMDEVERLRLVAEAMRFGFRAGVVVPATKEELEELIATAREEKARREAHRREAEVVFQSRQYRSYTEEAEVEFIPKLIPGCA